MSNKDGNPYAAPASAARNSDRSTKRYSVLCKCGRDVAVQASQAGSELTCQCGARLDVPPLSRLRASVGEDPIPLNTIDRIRLMIRNQELPKGEICSCCGRPANEIVVLRVQCERQWVKGGESSSRRLVFALLFLGWLGTIIALARPRRREEFGRDISVDVPVRVSSECRARILRTRGQRKLRNLLRETPIYQQLLDEFPRAIITPITATV